MTVKYLLDPGSDAAPTAEAQVDSHQHELEQHELERLRLKAREAIAAGALPRHRVERLWGGRGTGARCAVCALPVRPNELGFELDYAAGNGASAVPHFHVRCFAAWELECEPSSGVSTVGSTLAASASDGTLASLDRESPEEHGL